MQCRKGASCREPFSPSSRIRICTTILRRLVCLLYDCGTAPRFQSKVKAPAVESCIRVIRRAMQRHFELTDSFAWVSFLRRFLHGYNRRVHSTTKHTPLEMLENPLIILPPPKPVKTKPRPPPPIGSFVRLNRLKGVFDKEITGSWSREIFRVVKHRLTQPIPMMQVEDLNSQRIRGSFYVPEVQVVHFDPTIKVVDDIIKTRTVKGRKQYFVSYVGYPANHNAWVDSAKRPLTDS